MRGAESKTHTLTVKHTEEEESEGSEGCVSMVTSVVLCFDQSVMEDQRVQTCDVYRTDPDLPHRFNNPDCFHGYSQKRSHPLYRTSNQTYGSKKPTVHEIQTQFKGMSHQFSEAMLQSGMHRDHGFNTSVERSKVMVSTATQKNRSNLHHLYHYGNQSNDQDGNK